MVYGMQWGNEKVVHQINLLIPQDHFVYICQNLHEIPHGDERIQDKTNLDSELKCSGVNVVDVSTSTTLDSLRVYYSSSVLTMGIERSVKDLNSMQNNLFDHLFDIYGEKKINGTRDSTSGRLEFGIGQAQPSSKTCVDTSGRAHRLPHCNLKSFHAMNDALQAEIRDLLLYFKRKFNGKRGLYNCGYDDLRTKSVSDLFSDEGWDGPFVGWEYINISLRSADDTLHKHFDSKNDRRVGYNHSAVYSFLRSHSNEKYRVVIVMTYRNSMGCFMDSFLNRC